MQAKVEEPSSPDYKQLYDAHQQGQKLRAADALKFQQTGVESAAKTMEEDAKEEAASAAKGSGSGSEDGVEVEPAPGQNDEAVRVRNQDDYMEPVTATTQFMGSHSYEEDIKSLLEEIDQSENKVKGLKLRVVEKENFVDSLSKREEMLQQDLHKDKEAVENLHAHVKALKARIERVKKEKQLRLLEAQFHQYSAAAKRIGDQASELTRIKSLIYSKMKGLVGEIKPLQKQEDASMAESIDVQPGQEAAPAEAGEEAPATEEENEAGE